MLYLYPTGQYYNEMPKIIYFKGLIYRGSHYAKFNTSIWLPFIKGKGSGNVVRGNLADTSCIS